MSKEDFLSKSWITAAASKEASLKARPKALDPRKKVAVRLEEKKVLSHDTRLFRFSLPTKEHILGLPVGGHFFVVFSLQWVEAAQAFPGSTGDAHPALLFWFVQSYGTTPTLSFFSRRPTEHVTWSSSNRCSTGVKEGRKQRQTSGNVSAV